MAHTHDRKSSSLAGSSIAELETLAASGSDLTEEPLICATSATDPLSDVLRTVKLTGAVFHLVEASFPWGVEIPPIRDYSSIILPHAQHVISYHIITKGSGWVEVPGVASNAFEAGDILVLAHGDAYALLSSQGQTPEYDRKATLEFFRQWMAGKLSFVTIEGGGGAGGAEYVCGFLGCDLTPFNPLLSTLPRLLHLRRSTRDRNDLLERLIDLTLKDARLPRLGGESIRLRLSELIFVEVIRLWLVSMPAHQTGWLAGLRDPAIAKVLTLLHDRPAYPWTIRLLADEAGMSRTALAARFNRVVGYAPIEYLTLWRMQIAARLLTDSSMKVSAVGQDIGYRSEAAFSRAFKKHTGVSPSGWRFRTGTSLR